MQKVFVSLISTFLPGLMTKIAYNKLTSPQVKKLRANEIRVLDLSQKSTLQFKGFDIRLYEWKGGPETVLLVHGWEGQAGNFSDLVKKLMEENYSIIAFDGPSHGFSSKGKTSLFEFTDLVGELLNRYKPSKLISHSFGGVATTFALFQNPHIKIEKYVLLTTPDKFTDRIDDVSQKVGITKNVKTRLIKKLQQEIDMDVSKLNVSDFVKKINVGKALIIHDANDQVIPIRQSKNVAESWPNSSFQEISGTGHFRILRTDFVIESTVRFLK